MPTSGQVERSPPKTSPPSSSGDGKPALKDRRAVESRILRRGTRRSGADRTILRRTNDGRVCAPVRRADYRNVRAARDAKPPCRATSKRSRSRCALATRPTLSRLLSRRGTARQRHPRAPRSSQYKASACLASLSRLAVSVTWHKPAAAFAIDVGAGGDGKTHVGAPSDSPIS